MDEFTSDISEELIAKQSNFPKTVAFVRSYKDCSCIYSIIKRKSGVYFTAPPRFPDTSEFRLVDMYTRVLTNEKKSQVMESFSSASGKLRLIIATTAFGMGVDCPDITRIIHWGSPETVEEYIQETGRAARNGNPATATLYTSKSSRFASDTMKRYIKNNSDCRSKMLFKPFLMYSENSIIHKGCKCCDICRKLCKCPLCV